MEVPAQLQSYRALAEQFPTAPVTLTALTRLAEMYEDLGKHELAAAAWSPWLHAVTHRMTRGSRR